MAFDRAGVRLGPVVATPTRWSLLVAPYSLEVLGELLHRQDWVPGSLRFHGEGGYAVLPPSPTGTGRVRWERAPRPAGAAGAGAGRGLLAARAGAARRLDGLARPWLPDVASVVDVLVEQSAGGAGRRQQQARLLTGLS
ncbi:hypothetical protein GCM10020000_39280 [Streptomyces olivoverticillatus]